MLQDAHCTIRPARADDLPAVVEAYNAGIAERVAPFETQPRTVADIAAWLGDGQPFIVAERDGRVLGWAGAGSYSDRCVYQGVGEHAVYVHPDGRGLGLGRQLLTDLCAESERQGLYKLTSRASPPTTAPAALSTALPASKRSGPTPPRATRRPVEGLRTGREAARARRREKNAAAFHRRAPPH